MKKGIQIAIIVLAVTALVYGVSKMSAETSTMILPTWLIVVVVSLVVCVASAGIGLLAKRLLNSNWNQLTFASIIIIIVVGIYSTIEYKPTLNIFILQDFSGEVKLFVSKDGVERHDIKVNSYGIGYITKKDFEKGFYPKIVKGKSDISKEVKGYSKGTSLNNLSNSYSFKYLSFVVPGQSSHLTGDIDDLLKFGAIDTMRLVRKTVP